jgi:hypothetical protein
MNLFPPIGYERLAIEPAVTEIMASNMSKPV